MTQKCDEVFIGGTGRVFRIRRINEAFAFRLGFQRMRAAGMRDRHGADRQAADCQFFGFIMMHKADLGLKVIQRDGENGAAQIAGDGVVQCGFIFAKTVETNGAIRVEKRLEEGQAANMVGVKMRKTNVNIRHPLLHELAAQMDKTGTGIEYRQMRTRLHRHAACISAIYFVIRRVHGQ